MHSYAEEITCVRAFMRGEKPTWYSQRHRQTLECAKVIPVPTSLSIKSRHQKLAITPPTAFFQMKNLKNRDAEKTRQLCKPRHILRPVSKTRLTAFSSFCESGRGWPCVPARFELSC
jgi:hypothetical protein